MKWKTAWIVFSCACLLFAGSAVSEPIEESCEGRDAGYMCRPAQGECDVAEFCDGTSPVCPPDQFVPPDWVCRESNGPCDVAEHCDGYALCPPDRLVDPGTWCRDSTGGCDAMDFCDGLSAECQDRFAPQGEVCRFEEGPCDAPDYCSGTSPVCENQFQMWTECRPSMGVCDQPEFCEGWTAECPPDMFSYGNQCRSTAGECDQAEICNGSGPECPVDGFASGIMCRPEAGECDEAEYCEGNGPACPPDLFAAGEVCRYEHGPCDQAEICNGHGPTCPPDAFAAGELCRAAAGECDEDEYCDGRSAECPLDEFAYGELCRAAWGDCDQPEYCGGWGPYCPEDQFVVGELCRPAAGECDEAEFCNGAQPVCPEDVFVSHEITCREAAGICDVEERCTGFDAFCPGDLFATPAVLCRDAAGDCDVDEFCTGADPFCPSDVFADASVTCREVAGDCDVAERCTGGGPACPEDLFADASSLCRVAVGECDLDDFCTGTGAWCPVDAFVVAGTLCGDQVALGDCDDPDRCDGLGLCLQNLKPSSTICREDAGECDVADNCTGADPVCPDDAFEPAGTLCGNALENACTDADTCDGYGWCDPNNLPCGLATNSLLCTFSEGDCGDTDDAVFRLIYTPDVKAWPAYKLNASNPGQFGYNLIVDGEPGAETTVTIEVPYPFVTKGATPVRVYDADLLGFTSAGCFAPPSTPLATFDARIEIDDWILGSGGPNDGLYGLDCQSTTGPVQSNPAICTFEIVVTMPPSGHVYMHTHLDYGLKGKDVDANPPDLLADRYDAGPLDADGRDALQNNLTNDGVVRVSNCEEYGFEHTAGAEMFGDVVRSTNDFKKIAGVLGVAGYSATGEGVANLRVRLVRTSNGQEVVSGYTDRDGFYMLQYKHTGKPAMFTVFIGDGSDLFQQPIELKANGWAEVSFDLSTGTAFGEFGTGAEAPGNGKKK